MNCQSCSNDFIVPNEDLEFFRRISPTFLGRTFQVPAPTHCAECRFQRRLAVRNEYKYYSRSCSLCNGRVVSIHAEENPYPVYCNRCWWSDKWEPKAYGREYDLKRGFFDQFRELQAQVPQIAMMNDNGVASENCEYCQDFAYGKNCYLVTGSWQDQDCMYCTQTNQSKDVIDSLNCYECELSYECIASQNLYGCTYLSRSSGSSNCIFGIDLRGCNDCIACIGLRQKQYCIFNQEYSKSEYQQRLKELNLGSYGALEKLKNDFRSFALTVPHKAFHQLNCHECVGDGLFNCKDTQGFGFKNAEHCRYIWQGDVALNSYDVINTGRPEWCYECATPDESYMALFTSWCWKSKYLLYSDNCHSSESLFGCIGLKRGQYCILNKAYTKTEYETLVSAIIETMMARGEWGEFFPMSHSPFAYNETRAQGFFPLTKAEALKRGLRWRDEPAREQKVEIADIPDHIQDVNESCIKQPLSCVDCSKLFKVIDPELKFYRKSSLPLPRLCPDCRRNNRLIRYPTTGKIYERNCAKCSQAIKSSYSSERAEIIFCESCYEQSCYE